MPPPPGGPTMAPPPGGDTIVPPPTAPGAMNPETGGGRIIEAIGTGGASSSGTSAGGIRILASSCGCSGGTTTCGRVFARARACLVLVSCADVRSPGERSLKTSERLCAVATAAWSMSFPVTALSDTSAAPPSAAESAAAMASERRRRDCLWARALRERRIAASMLGCRATAFSTASLGRKTALSIKSRKVAAP